MAGVNDITILYGIITFLLILGFVTPFINDTFGTSHPGYNKDFLESTVGEEDFKVVTKTSLQIWRILVSMGTMFFWTFGGLPAWMDILMFVPRLTLVLIIARNVWIGGGG